MNRSGDYPAEWHCLRPYHREEAQEVHWTALDTGVSDRTIRNWCLWHGIGRRNLAGGPWAVSRVALSMFLDGNIAALDAYLAGQRQGAPVAQYYERLGLGYLLDLPEFGSPLTAEKSAKPGRVGNDGNHDVSNCHNLRQVDQKQIE
jgi:hypothetical protein